MNIKKRAYLCEMLMNELHWSIDNWINRGSKTWQNSHNTDGENKTAIKNDIVRLRRELLNLYKAVDEC